MKKQTGFTLIELMIAVVILGVLAGFALTNYQQYVLKSNRAEAKAELMNVATRLQRCYTTYGKFNPSDGCTVYDSLKDAGTITSEGKGFYTVDIKDETATQYTLTATAAKAPQTGDKKGTDCTVLTLTHTGAKTPADCW
jgi:type IV pilus assembly protein PilE